MKISEQFKWKFIAACCKIAKLLFLFLVSIHYRFCMQKLNAQWLFMSKIYWKLYIWYLIISSNDNVRFIGDFMSCFYELKKLHQQQPLMCHYTRSIAWKQRKIANCCWRCFKIIPLNCLCYVCMCKIFSNPINDDSI